MKIQTILIAVLLLGLWAGCSKNNHLLPPPSVSSSSDLMCKRFYPLKSGDPGPDQSCIRWVYDRDASILTLTHYNAGFNCCPEAIQVDLEVKGDSLLISEDDSLELCRCLCLYDVDIVIRDLPSDLYYLRIKEPCVTDSHPFITCTLDLSGKSSGQYCLKRTYYPWGE
ncbi:MAG: hypothetical protein J7L89_05130 [Bacteroidales bacterium]|nr:hypothetical protein [Bacteroidales bacterium]